MIAAIVQYKLPPPVTLDQAQAISDAAPEFRNIPGLFHKYFLLSEDSETAGGVYLWRSRKEAERFYTEDFKQSIVEQYGSEPSVTYFDSSVMVDNLIG